MSLKAWERVVSVENISFTVDDGLEEVNLYGNNRHCVQVIVYFNGRDQNGDLVDLSEGTGPVSFNLSESQVRLINQANGQEFKYEVETVNEIRCASKASRFSLHHGVLRTGYIFAGDSLAKRGKVGCFVYASTKLEFKRTIGAKFIFANGSTYNTTQDSRTSQFARIHVLRERRYTTADLDTFSYTETAREAANAVQWDAYIKLKNEIWVFSEFDNYHHTHSQPYFACHNAFDYGYYYFMWPVGPQGVYDLKRDNGNHWMTVTYNKVHGALNLVMIKGNEESTNHGDVTIRLYDPYGNEGRFKLDWNKTITDSTEATVVDAN